MHQVPVHTETHNFTVASGSGSSFSTPRKNPRDLSHLFDAVSPQRKHESRSGSDIGTPKSSGRMLSRSKTESSLESSPSRSPRVLSKMQSLMEPPERSRSLAHRDMSPSPIRNGHAAAVEDMDTVGTSGSQSQSQSQSQSRDSSISRRTYAGNSRSFLVALPTSSLAAQTLMNGMKEEPRDEDEEYARDSYAELRKRFGVDNSEV